MEYHLFHNCRFSYQFCQLVLLCGAFSFLYQLPLLQTRTPQLASAGLSTQAQLSLSLSASQSLELANTRPPALEEREPTNRTVVRALYEALRLRDRDAVHRILAPDLEWWFHGPPSHQFLMRLLTGASSSASTTDDAFLFVPDRVTSFGPTVLAEGFETARSIFWVHAWTVSADGIVTQVREYFNTSLTVTHFGGSSRSDPSTAEIASLHCPSLWESSVSSKVGKSVPGLVLAI